MSKHNHIIWIKTEMNNLYEEKAAKQKKLWEIDKNMMCSVIGTCLSMEEARRIGRRFGAKCDDEKQIDSMIHAMLVRNCVTQNSISTHVNKFLNKKFSGLVRVFQNLRTSKEVLENWQRLLSEGIIPGGYWAAVTHNGLAVKDKTRIFSDVHMLSHLVGSSNQSLIKRLVEYEGSIKRLEARHGSSQRKLQQKIEEQEKTLIKLQENAKTLKHALKNQPANYGKRDSMPCHESKLRILRQRHKRLYEDKRELQETADERLRRINDAERKIKMLEQNLQSLELAVQHASKANQEKGNLLLNNMLILYVGGLHSSTKAMETLVQNMGGKLVHHNGGSGKKELSNLPVLVADADAVIVPMDNVSHASALEAKRACKLFQRPYMPVKSSGLGALASALSEIHGN